MMHGTINGYTRHACRCEHCAEAGRLWREKRKARARASAPPRLSVEPIYALLDDSNRREISNKLKRYKVKGIPIYNADFWCCKLGVHPWMVYGDAYFQDLWAGDHV
jgi:hypothetical protein